MSPERTRDVLGASTRTRRFVPQDTPPWPSSPLRGGRQRFGSVVSPANEFLEFPALHRGKVTSYIRLCEGLVGSPHAALKGIGPATHPIAAEMLRIEVPCGPWVGPHERSPDAGDASSDRRIRRVASGGRRPRPPSRRPSVPSSGRVSHAHSVRCLGGRAVSGYGDLPGQTAAPLPSGTGDLGHLGSQAPSAVAMWRDESDVCADVT